MFNKSEETLNNIDLSGFSFPAEWQPHRATWLTYPHSEASFPSKMNEVKTAYLRFIAAIAESEQVCINVSASAKSDLEHRLHEAGIDLTRVSLYERESDDVWCRDHGPAFVVHPDGRKAVINWEFNAWGGKYPYTNDNRIAAAIARDLALPIVSTGIVMEGGSVEFNGDGSLLTTRACLLNPNRNPQLTQKQIEEALCRYYGVHQILWLGDGIAGDDTDGHIDDMTRFIADDTVVTAVETNRNDVNYKPLQDNLNELKHIRLHNGKQLNIIELPMPEPIIYDGQRFPASYSNFYFTNKAVIMPAFHCPHDDEAARILEAAIPNRRVIQIDSTDIVRGFGSFHCLSQQEPV